MKNKLIAGLITAVLVSQSSYASSLNKYDLEKRSLEVSSQLIRIAQLNSSDSCAGDITVAAAYVESAAHDLQRDKHLTALTSLTYGQNELKEISNIRSHCAQLATEVKPYFAKIILIKNELENEPPPAPDQTSD